MLDPLTKAKPWLSIKETSQVLGNYFNKEVKKVTYIITHFKDYWNYHSYLMKVKRLQL